MLHKLSDIRLSVFFLMTLAAYTGHRASGQQPQHTADEQEILAAAERIHREAVTIDTHVDIAGAEYATERLDPGIDNPKLKCDLVKMVQGGVDAVFLAVWIGQGKRDADGYKRAYDNAITQFKAIHRLAENMYPDRCQLAVSPDGAERIIAGGKRAVTIGVENGYAIGEDLSNVRKFYDLGARYITLSHVGHNQICDSSNPSSKLGDEQSEHNGLSPFGRQVVVEMNRLGMMVDVSHISSESFFDVIQVSRAPVIASHSGCRALSDNARNLDDRQLEALAKNGGVIQIVALDAYLKAPSRERRHAIKELAARISIPTGPLGAKLSEATASQRRQLREGEKEVDQQYPPAGLKDYVDHIEQAAKVAGIDHVGIGTDFDGGGGIQGFNDHSEARNVTVELVRRGYSEEAIKKIWGGNILRVWREVEKVAAESQ